MRPEPRTAIGSAPCSRKRRLRELKPPSFLPFASVRERGSRDAVQITIVGPVSSSVTTPFSAAHIMLLVVEPCVCGPPVTFPPAATCCCTAWVSCGLVVFAVQPACPLAIEAARALTETPHTFAATSIGTCAFTGILARSTLIATERSLSTFCRLTLTRVGMLLPVPPPPVPPLPVVPLPPPDGAAGVPAPTSLAELGPGAWVVLHPAMTSVAPAATAKVQFRSVIPLSCSRLFRWRRPGIRGLRGGLRSRRGRWGRCRGRGGLGSAADRSVGGELLLNGLRQLGRACLGGAALAAPATGADRQDVDRHAANIGRDGDRDLGVDWDVRLVDLQVEGEVVEHIGKIDVDQRRRDPANARSDGASGALDALHRRRRGFAG